jgi:hypothetical protein
MSSPPTPPRGPTTTTTTPRSGRGVVVVVVGQAQGVAGLVHDHDLVVGARPVPRLPLPGVLGGVEPLAVELEVLVAERGLIAPPEVGPTVVRAGPDDDEIVDGPVAVVVVAREVVALGVEVSQGLLDQGFAGGRGHGHRSPRVGRPVPAEDGAADLEHVVGCPAVVVADALVGIAGVAVTEQLGGDRRYVVDGGEIREVEEQGEDLDAALGRQSAPPAAGQGQAFGRLAGGEKRRLQPCPQPVDEQRVDEMVAQGLGIGQSLGEGAVALVQLDFGRGGRLEAQAGYRKGEEGKDSGGCFAVHGPSLTRSGAGFNRSGVRFLAASLYNGGRIRRVSTTS